VGGMASAGGHARRPGRLRGVFHPTAAARQARPRRGDRGRVVRPPTERERAMNGPLGLPVAASAHAGEVDHTMVLVHVLMAVLFVGWILFFLYALYRFRRKNNPVADYKGVTSHTST